MDLGVGAAFHSVCGFAGLRFATAVDCAFRCARNYVLAFVDVCAFCCCWRPYRVECTGSRSASEVKRHRARLILGWGSPGRPQGAASFCVRPRGVPLGSWCWCCVSFRLLVCGFALRNHAWLGIAVCTYLRLGVGCFLCCMLLLAAIPRRMHRISSALRRKATQVSVSTGVGPTGKTSGCCQLLRSVAPRLPASHRLRVICVVCAVVCSASGCLLAFGG